MREHVKCLHHVGIPTRDMDATIRFYTDLGAEIYFQKMDQEAGEPIRVVIFDFYGMKVEAYERRVTAGQPGAIDHIAFQVTGIEAVSYTHLDVYKRQDRPSGPKRSGGCERNPVQSQPCGGNLPG